MKEEDILSLRKGEVVKYMGEYKERYLIVTKIDREKRIVYGEVTIAPGVNAVSLDVLIEKGIDIARWEKT